MLAGLTTEQSTELGACLVAAAMYQAHNSRVLCSQFWIPLDNGVHALHMGQAITPTMSITTAQVESALDMLDSVSVSVSELDYTSALAQFTKQECHLTVQRIRTLNQASYRHWRIGNYDGLLMEDGSAALDKVWVALSQSRLSIRDVRALCRYEGTEHEGVLVFPVAAFYDVLHHEQVLRIAQRAYRSTAISLESIPAVDAMFVQESEMRFSKRIYDVAAQFASDAQLSAQRCNENGSTRGQLLLVTGPSASGKTTFAQRLSLALRSVGYGAVTISMDEYYRDSKADPHYPHNPDGTPNHELVECLNLEGLVADINALLLYQQVELPRFDMVNSKPKPKTGENKVALSRTSGLKPLIIVEGIFAIHPTFVQLLDNQKETSTKVFVVPLPTLGLTELVVPTNQTTRLLRRVSRDFLHRGRNARASIARLPGVVKGENEGIFPLLRHADLVFNTFVDYEIRLLSVYATPLLTKVEPTDVTFPVAQGLVNLLNGVQGVSDRAVGKDSLVREFIGGSTFEVEMRTFILDNHTHVVTSKDHTTSLLLHDHPLHRNQHGARGRRVVDELLDQLAADESNNSTTPSLAPDEVLAVLGNRQVVSLNLPLEGSDYFCGTTLRPLNISSAAGMEAYDQTALLLLHAAVKQTLGHHRRVLVVHRFVEEGNRYCIRIQEGDEVLPITDAMQSEVLNAMHRLHNAKEEIHLRYVSRSAAVALLSSQDMRHAVRLVESCTRPKILVAIVSSIPSLCLQPLLPTVAHVDVHQLTLVATDASRLEWTFTIGKQHIPPPPSLCSALFDVRRSPIDTPATTDAVNSRRRALQAHGNVFSVGDVNHMIASGHSDAVMAVDEALEFHNLYNLLNRVEMEQTRILFVAGSSSSGKSVITAKMQLLLAAHGYSTSVLSTDDYYRNLAEDDYPTFSNGTKNTESVDALRLSLLGQHIRDLVTNGVTINAPMFDCGTGNLLSTTRVVHALPPARGVLIVEGLFALSPRVEEIVGDASIPTLHVMVHPIPMLNLDELHIISAMRMRLLRRIVRDHNTRGRTAGATLDRRQFVSEGEILNTLPFAERADIVVNASCLYELNSLRSACETLLNFVPDSLTGDNDTVLCAVELKEILSWVCAMPQGQIWERDFVSMLVKPDP